MSAPQTSYGLHLRNSIRLVSEMDFVPEGSAPGLVRRELVESGHPCYVVS